MSTFYYSNNAAREKTKNMEDIMGDKQKVKYYYETGSGLYEEVAHVNFDSCITTNTTDFGQGGFTEMVGKNWLKYLTETDSKGHDITVNKNRILNQMSAVDDSRVWGNPCKECVSNLYPSLRPGSNLVAGTIHSIETSIDSSVQAYIEVDCKLTNDLYDFIMKDICNSGKENNMKSLKIKKVVFNPPATIVFWNDNTKTVVKSTNETYDGEKGMAMAIAKKFLGTNDSKSNYYDEFRKWLKDAPDCPNCKYDSQELTSTPCWCCDQNYSHFERKDD